MSCTEMSCAGLSCAELGCAESRYNLDILLINDELGRDEVCLWRSSIGSQRLEIGSNLLEEHVDLTGQCLQVAITYVVRQSSQGLGRLRWCSRNLLHTLPPLARIAVAYRPSILRA